MVVATLSLYPYALQDLAALVAGFVVGVVGASAAEIAAFAEGSIEDHEVDLAVVIVALVALPTAMEARQTPRAGLAMAEADLAVDLTVTAGITEEVAAAVVTAAVMTTDLAAAAVVATAALIVPGLAATQNRLALVTAVAAAAAAVGIATETTTDETTPGSALMKVVQAMKESGSFVGTNRK